MGILCGIILTFLNNRPLVREMYTYIFQEDGCKRVRLDKSGSVCSTKDKATSISLAVVVVVWGGQTGRALVWSLIKVNWPIRLW